MVAEVGARIRSLRTAKGLTQAQVAEPNYTKAYISMLESGRTRASMKALEHIAGVLGVKPADLLGGVAAPATPQYQLLEARRYIEQQRAAEAIPILESLEEGRARQLHHPHRVRRSDRPRSRATVDKRHLAEEDARLEHS